MSYFTLKKEDILPKTRQRQIDILILTLIDSYFFKHTYNVIYINGLMESASLTYLYLLSKKVCGQIH